MKHLGRLNTISTLRVALLSAIALCGCGHSALADDVGRDRLTPPAAQPATADTTQRARNGVKERRLTGHNGRTAQPLIEIKLADQVQAPPAALDLAGALVNGQLVAAPKPTPALAAVRTRLAWGS